MTNDYLQDVSVLDDIALCNMVSSGDQAAEEILVLRYNWLVRACARPLFLLGSDHEDLIQEGMLGLLQAIRKFDASKNVLFRTFAERCIRNRLYTVIRDAASERHAILTDSISLDVEGQDALFPITDDPEAQMLDRFSHRDRLNRAWEMLTPLETQVLQRYLKGLTYQEIGSQLSRTPKAVDNAVQRIRRKLQQIS